MYALKIYYYRYSSPLGTLFIASTPDGVCDIQIGGGPEGFRLRLTERYGGELIENEDRTRGVYEWIERYLSGTPQAPQSLRLDLHGTAFEQKVWNELLKIPYGEVRTYGWIARAVGVPGGARAVGRACARNPLPIIVPCHRVIAASGRMGGYSAGREIKQRLLRMEGSWPSEDSPQR